MTPAEVAEQLQRIEEKLDKLLERQTATEGRVAAHELVAGAMLALMTLGLGAWAVIK